MKRVVTAALMRAMDRETIEERGIEGYTLMTAAGREVAHTVLEHFDVEDGQLVIALCGKGNNGGDAFVAAAVLKDAGASVIAMLVGGAPGDLSGDAARAQADWAEAGGETHAVRTEADWEKARPLLEEADLVIDGLLGTGTRGAPRGIAAYVIDDLRDIEAPQVSIDLPSGIDADTGAAPGPYVDADLTVTLALPKRGLMLFPGRAASGPLRVADIGIPEDVLESGDGLRVEVPEPLDLAVRLPRRHPTMHKGDRGRRSWWAGARASPVRSPWLPRRRCGRERGWSPPGSPWGSRT
jgi:NAD(P)H-hydrate epimerase